MKILTLKGYVEAPYICSDVKYCDIKSGEVFVFGTEEEHEPVLWVKRDGYGYEAQIGGSVIHADPKDIGIPVCIIHDKTGKLHVPRGN